MSDDLGRSPSLRDRVRDEVIGRLDLEHSGPVDLADSVLVLEVLVAIEEVLAVELPEYSIESWYTLDDAVDSAISFKEQK